VSDFVNQLGKGLVRSDVRRQLAALQGSGPLAHNRVEVCIASTLLFGNILIMRKVALAPFFEGVKGIRTHFRDGDFSFSESTIRTAKEIRTPLRQGN
jgi:hypothetical protein